MREMTRADIGPDAADRGGRTRLLIRFAAVVLCAAAAGVLSPKAAPAASVFEVSNVAVDVTADTATAARERALADGERTAFRRLLERLTLGSDHPRLPDLPRAEISNYLQDFSVADEKSSAVRYLAKLTVRFKADEVRRLLDRLGVPFAETMSKPVLVLPVYQSAGALLLWDDPNPWRSAWVGQVSHDGLVPMVFATGDLPDIAAIGAEQAAAGDESRLAAVARRHGTTDTVVAVATVGYASQQPFPHVRVFISRHGSSAQKGRTEIEVQGISGESIEGLLRRAAGMTAKLVEDLWKRENLLRLDSASVAAVSVPIVKLADWLAVRKRLGNVSVVRRADVVLMSRAEVQLNLQFIGEPDQLVLALSQADLQLTREGDIWVLTLGKPGSG